MTFTPNEANPSFLYVLNGNLDSGILQQFNCKDGSVNKYQFSKIIDFNNTKCKINSISAFLDNSRLMYCNSTLLTLEGELHIIQSYTILSMYHLKWDNQNKKMKILFRLGQLPIISSIKPCKDKIWIICAAYTSSVRKAILCIKEYSTNSDKWIIKAEYENIGSAFRYIQLQKRHIRFIAVYGGRFLLAFNYLTTNNEQGIYIFDIKNKQMHKSKISMPNTIYSNDTIYVSSIINNKQDQQIVHGFVRPITNIIRNQIPLYLIDHIAKWYNNEYIQLTLATKFNKKMTSFSINVDLVIQEQNA